MNFESALQELEKNGYVVWDDFLSPKEMELLRKDYSEIRNQGFFKRAGIGKGQHFHVNDEIRKDEIYWLDFQFPSPVQALLQKKLEAFKHRLNEGFFLGLWDFEGHYSFYPPGGHYHPHLDRFSNDDSRAVSMVLYLNESWKESDGGQLKIHLKQKNPELISPISGRLVCFFSDSILHEVLPSHQPRQSFAGWWRLRR